MPHFIYRIQLKPKYRKAENRGDEYKSIIAAHFNYLKNACEKGQVQMAGRTDLSEDDEQNFGICIFKAENEAQAKHFTENDPAVKNQVMDAEIFPFSLALWQENLET